MQQLRDERKDGVRAGVSKYIALVCNESHQEQVEAAAVDIAQLPISCASQHSGKAVSL